MNPDPCGPIDTPDRKRQRNEELFGAIAATYDRVNQPLSLGRDRAWKRSLIASLPPIDAPRCLDLACGTGDLTELLAQRYPSAGITGIDLTPAMVDRARQRLGTRARILRMDMDRLEFPDASFDIVTGGYALRNAPDLPRALAEIRRVLKPGGTAAFLDFSKPPSRIFQSLEILFLTVWCGLFGLLLHGRPGPYTYIAASLQQFPDRAAFRRLLQEQGLVLLESRTAFFGVIEQLTIQKP